MKPTTATTTARHSVDTIGPDGWPLGYNPTDTLGRMYDLWDRNSGTPWRPAMHTLDTLSHKAIVPMVDVARGVLVGVRP